MPDAHQQQTTHNEWFGAQDRLPVEHFEIALNCPGARVVGSVGRLGGQGPLVQEAGCGGLAVDL